MKEVVLEVVAIVMLAVLKVVVQIAKFLVVKVVHHRHKQMHSRAHTDVLSPMVIGIACVVVIVVGP